MASRVLTVRTSVICPTSDKSFLLGCNSFGYQGTDQVSLNNFAVAHSDILALMFANSSFVLSSLPEVFLVRYVQILSLHNF